MTIFVTHSRCFTTFRRLPVAKEYMETQLILFEGESLSNHSLKSSTIEVLAAAIIHPTPPIHPLHFHQWFLLLVLPTDLLLQQLNRHLLLYSSLVIYQSAPVALTVILNLQLLPMTCASGTLDGNHFNLMEHLNPSLLLLITAKKLAVFLCIEDQFILKFFRNSMTLISTSFVHLEVYCAEIT